MDCIKSHRRILILVLTPILLIPLLPLYEQIGLTQRACNCLYMLLLMAVYWCTESLPLGLTALIPLGLAPPMGILKASIVCNKYFTDKIVLMFASMVVALAIQESGLHRRIALTFIKIFGIKPRMLMLGFMVPTWFLSMWISNTATSVMMVSILNCVINKLAEHNEVDDVGVDETSEKGFPLEDMSTIRTMTAASDVNIEVEGPSGSQSDSNQVRPSLNRFEPTAKCLCLAVCYAATCGGVSTLTGTGTNLIFYDLSVEFGERLEYDFGITLLKWIGFAMPISMVLLAICWVWLQVLFLGIKKSGLTKQDEQKIRTVMNGEYATLGKMTWGEGVTLAHFLALIILWLARDPGKVGGWGDLFQKGYVTDGTAAMLVMLSITLFPKHPPQILGLRGSRPFESLLPWKMVLERLSWNVLFLLGGGLALADCVAKSGLSKAIGDSLDGLSEVSPVVIVLVICIVTAGMTEFTSNIVIGTMMMPIVGNMALRMSLNPLYFMIPCCVSSSFAFMLPVATPPNAVVYSAGVLRIVDMVKAGVILNIIAVGVVMLGSMTWAPLIFRYDEFIHNATLTSESAAVLNSTVF